MRVGSHGSNSILALHLDPRVEGGLKNENKRSSESSLRPERHCPGNGIPRKSSAGVGIARPSCDNGVDTRTNFDTFSKCPGMDLYLMT